MKPARDLLKHSSIYMIGQILTRLASVLLLPFYTNVLTPADYGVVAILDLTAAILATLVAGGLVAAVTRYHFDEDDSRHMDRVWWTGLSMVAVFCVAICLPMWLARHTLATVTLGDSVTQGAWFYTLTIMTLCLTVTGMVLEAYLRVMKWSGLFVGISLVRLFFNIGLNVWLIVGWQMGVEGLLVGNLVANVIYTAVLFGVYLRSRGRFCIDQVIGKEMMKFAAPMVVMAITTMMMHEADRYFLQIWKGMESVGVYSLAHKIGFAVNTLCLLPFLSIWNVSIYDIERLPDANKVFGKMFGWFVAGLGILLLGASLTIHPVLPLLTPDSYGNAVDVVPLVLAGFFVFSLSFMFQVPALLSKRTRLVIPASICGLLVNVGANCLLIPIMGMWGAGWAGVITYATYSFMILFACRPVMKIGYPWMSAAVTLAGLSTTYLVVRYGCFPHIGAWAQLALSVTVCAIWAAVLFGREGLDLLVEFLAKRRASAGNAVEQSPDEESVEIESAKNSTEALVTAS